MRTATALPALRGRRFHRDARHANGWADRHMQSSVRNVFGLIPSRMRPRQISFFSSESSDGIELLETCDNGNRRSTRARDDTAQWRPGLCRRATGRNFRNGELSELHAYLSTTRSASGWSSNCAVAKDGRPGHFGRRHRTISTTSWRSFSATRTSWRARGQSPMKSRRYQGHQGCG